MGNKAELYKQASILALISIFYNIVEGIICIYFGLDDVSTVSILTMVIFIHYKIKVGKQLNSKAILADANSTKACVYLSVVLLLASVGYEITGIGYMDSIGAILIAWLSFKEGKESFQKANGISCCDCESC